MAHKDPVKRAAYAKAWREAHKEELREYFRLRTARRCKGVGKGDHTKKSEGRAPRPLAGDAKDKKEKYDAMLRRVSETGKKICSMCQEDLPIERFYARKKRGVRELYYSPWCKECHTIRTSVWGKNNLAKRREITKRCHRKYHYQAARYGISPAEYEKMLKAQNGLCAICGQKETRLVHSRPSRLAIDHDHVTNKVRELLCARCNTILGYAKDSSTILFRAAAYLEKHRECQALEEMLGVQSGG